MCKHCVGACDDAVGLIVIIKSSKRKQKSAVKFTFSSEPRYFFVRVLYPGATVRFELFTHSDYIPIATLERFIHRTSTSKYTYRGEMHDDDADSVRYFISPL